MTHGNWIVIDLETYPDESAILEEPEADKRLKDPEKIAADLKDKRQQQRERQSIDPYAGRIVCIGWQTDQDADPQVLLCPTEDDEVAALLRVARVIWATSRHVVGFRVIGFDWPWLVTRARILGVAFPQLETRKYGNRDITDLHSLLTFDGNCPEAAMRRSLTNFARRFGIPVTDTTRGSDIADMMLRADWTGIRSHCVSDVSVTVALARKLVVIADHVEPEAF